MLTINIVPTKFALVKTTPAAVAGSASDKTIWKRWRSGPLTQDCPAERHAPRRNHGFLTTLIGEGMIRIAKDSVCGMEVGWKTAAATSEDEGKTCYFCAPGCRRAFGAAPKKYLAAS